MTKHIYIAWVKYQRRLESMKPIIGFTVYYLPPPYEKSWLKPLGYLRQAISTIQIIERERPSVVWYQSPPTFLAHLLAGLRKFGRNKFKIVADCHNAALRAPWGRLPGVSHLLNGFDLVLAHNNEVIESARNLGVTTDRLHALEDPPAHVEASNLSPRLSPLALVPCSFHADEPITTLLEAARLTPEVEFKITGNLNKARAFGYLDRAPENVKFTGFLPIEEFDDLLRCCDVLIGITTSEGIQLSVASEGVGAAKAMVLSDTQILRRLFGDAAIMTENAPSSLSAAVRSAIQKRSELEQLSKHLLERRRSAWNQAIEPFLNLLEDRVNNRQIR